MPAGKLDNSDVQGNNYGRHSWVSAQTTLLTFETMPCQFCSLDIYFVLTTSFGYVKLQKYNKNFETNDRHERKQFFFMESNCQTKSIKKQVSNRKYLIANVI